MTVNVLRFCHHLSVQGKCHHEADGDIEQERTEGRLSYVNARVEVHERMDGSLAVYYRGQCLATKPAPPEAPVLRVRHTARVVPNIADSSEVAVPAMVAEKTSRLKTSHYTKPGPDHPWRRPFKIHIDRG